MDTLDNDVDRLADWIARRERQNHTAAAVWLMVTASTGILALLSDHMLLLPLIPVAAAAVWLAVIAAADSWWRWRTVHAGHPVVRADAAWSLAAGRPLPAGWHETTVPGEVHRTAAGWLWRPSGWAYAGLPTILWTREEVAVSTITPVWTPLPPSVGQLRLYLHGGSTVVLLVRRPERLIEEVGVGTAYPV